MEYYMKIPGATLEVHRPQHLAVIRIGKNTLNLVKLNLQPPFHLEIETEDVDGLYNELTSEGFPTEGKPVSKPWGKEHFILAIQRETILSFLKMKGNRIPTGAFV